MKEPAVYFIVVIFPSFCFGNLPTTKLWQNVDNASLTTLETKKSKVYSCSSFPAGYFAYILTAPSHNSLFEFKSNIELDPGLKLAGSFGRNQGQQ